MAAALPTPIDCCQDLVCSTSTTSTGGTFLNTQLQGDGPPTAPPPIASLAWSWDNRVTSERWFWNIVTQAWE